MAADRPCDVARPPPGAGQDMSDPRLHERDLDLLAGQAAEGNDPAREALLAALRVRLLPVAKRRVREEDSEDLVHDGLRIVLEKLGARAVRRPILIWSYAVLRNVIGNYYQKRQRRGEEVCLQDERLVAPGTSLQPAEVAGDEMEALGSAPTAPEMARALARLSRQHPRCAVLFGLILECLGEIGDPAEATREALCRMRMQDGAPTRNALYVLLHRCRTRLRRLLDEETDKES